MLEMLNPSAGVVARFAASAVAFRWQYGRTLKQSEAKAQALLVERFCSPPASARRTPDALRLRDDAARYFGWKPAQWHTHHASAQALVAAAKTSTLQHLGQTVALYRWLKAKGTASKGQLLLCHGWEGYALNFVLLIQHAVAQGWDVVAFDHLAHGRSGGTKSGLPIVLSTLLAVGQHVGPVQAVVAHSLGGAAALHACAHQTLDTQRLALLAPFYDTGALTSMWCTAQLLDGDAKRLLRAGLEAESGMRIADFMPEQVGPRLKTPTLVVHDRQDRMTAFKHSDALAKSAPQAQLLEVSKLGHVAVLAHAPTVASVLAFCAASA
jgi:pimeloyl-ACP methyl ester carboxylesterase